jgi:hypothetical protein
MPYIDVDIDTDDYYRQCSDWEKRDLLKSLKEDGFLNGLEAEEPYTTGQAIFNDNIEKLKTKYFQLTNEEIELIEKLAKKY